jgi:hypothetical protein
MKTINIETNTAINESCGTSVWPVVVEEDSDEGIATVGGIPGCPTAGGTQVEVSLHDMVCK